MSELFALCDRIRAAKSDQESLLAWRNLVADGTLWAECCKRVESLDSHELAACFEVLLDSKTQAALGLLSDPEEVARLRRAAARVLAVSMLAIARCRWLRAFEDSLGGEQVNVPDASLSREFDSCRRRLLEEGGEEEAHLLLVTQRDLHLITDFRYDTQVRDKCAQLGIILPLRAETLSHPTPTRP